MTSESTDPILIIREKNNTDYKLSFDAIVVDVIVTATVKAAVDVYPIAVSKSSGDGFMAGLFAPITRAIKSNRTHRKESTNKKKKNSNLTRQ